MSATEIPRFDDEFRAAFNLHSGCVARCRAELNGTGPRADHERVRLALGEVGHWTDENQLGVASLQAMEDLERVTRVMRSEHSSPTDGDVWRLPVAAGTGRASGVLDGLSDEQRERAGWLELLGCWLGDNFPGKTAHLEMPVLTRISANAGEVATLRLRALDAGPPGLFPHPTMALFYGDPEFRAGVANAWRAVGTPRRSATWELRVGDRALDHLTGGSAGGAFAVALAHLERRVSRRVRIGPGVRPRSAVSAELRSDGSLARVEGRDAKLRAAAEAGVRLVVLADDDEAGGPLEPHIERAADVEQAVRLTRARISRLGAATAALLLAAAVTVGVLAVQNHRSSERNERERLARGANEVLARAGETGRDDLQLQQRLLLAAVSLARSAGNRELAQRALARGGTLEAGVLERLDLPLAGPVDGLVAVDGGRKLIAWSSSGHLRMFEADSGRQVGGYVHPPGAQSLAQPIPRATATLPGSSLAAFVFQNPLRRAFGEPRATLVIFSTAGELRVIGKGPHFTSEATTAIGYAPSGTRLLTASSRTLIEWNVTSGEPQPWRSCRWRPPGVRGAPVQVLTLPGGRPGLMLDRGQIVRLTSWELPESPRCAGRPVAGALPGVRAKDFTNESLALADNTEDEPVQLGLRSDGRLAVRRLGGAARTVDLGARATGIGVPQGGQVPVQFGKDRQVSLRVFDLVGTRLRADMRYRGQSLPAVAGAGFHYASQHRRVTQLNTSSMVYPPATAELGRGYEVVNGVATTDRALALAYPGSALVLGLRDRGLDSRVTWPSGMQLAGGDGRFNAGFSLSESGHYLAAVLDGKNRRRELLLYETARRAAIDVGPQLRRFTTLAPLGVAFEPGTDRLLVGYLNGLLVRLWPGPSGWEAEALMRGRVGRQAFGLTVSDRSIFRIETLDGRSRVARYDLDGREQQAWSLAPTGASFGLTGDANNAQLAVMSVSRAALILGSGAAYKLEGNGHLGRAFNVGDGPVLNSTQIGPDELLVTRYRGTTLLHWGSGVAEDSTRRFGPLNVAAASPDFALLAGSAFLSASVVATSLRSDAQTALLCDAAGGDLSEAAWRQFVGADLPYRPLCADFRRQGRALGFLAFRSRHLPEPLTLATPTPSEARALGAACRAQPALSWVAAPADGSAGAVCAGGQPVWLGRKISDVRVSRGGRRGRPLLLVSATANAGPEPEKGPPWGPDRATRVGELLDRSGNVVAEFVTPGGTAAVLGERVVTTEVVGKLLLTTTYVADPRGAGWIAREQLPAGTTAPPKGS
jgi:hypothetical protein